MRPASGADSSAARAAWAAAAGRVAAGRGWPHRIARSAAASGRTAWPSSEVRERDQVRDPRAASAPSAPAAGRTGPGYRADPTAAALRSVVLAGWSLKRFCPIKLSKARAVAQHRDAFPGRLDPVDVDVGDHQLRVRPAPLVHRPPPRPAVMPPGCRPPPSARPGPNPGWSRPRRRAGVSLTGRKNIAHRVERTGAGQQRPLLEFAGPRTP